MPPRHAYWTIIVDSQPTAFRAHDPEELLATLNRLKEKHPSAVMKWFERGQLWDSRNAAREQGLGRGERRWEGSRPDRGAPVEARGADQRSEHRRPPRDRDWRPGGEHRDPRQKYKDAKKEKWRRFKQNQRARWEHKQPTPVPDPETFSPPHGDPLRDQIDKPPRADRSWRGKSKFDRPRDDRQRDDRRWDDRSESNRPRDDRPRFGGKPGGGFKGRKPFSGRQAGGFRGAPPAGGHGPERKPFGAKPGGDRRPKPLGPKPGSGRRPKPFGPRKPWGTSPKGGQAGGRKLSRPPGPGHRPPRRGPRKRDDEE